MKDKYIIGIDSYNKQGENTSCGAFIINTSQGDVITVRDRDETLEQLKDRINKGLEEKGIKLNVEI